MNPLVLAAILAYAVYLIVVGMRVPTTGSSGAARWNRAVRVRRVALGVALIVAVVVAALTR